MFLKLLAFVAAIVPAYLFVRAMLGQRISRPVAAWREAKSEARKQIDRAISIFLVLVGCIVAFALGRLAWAWWTAA